MITFNVQSDNGNYYRGHEPSNDHANCWSVKQIDALVFTIEQVRGLVEAWKGHLNIVISIKVKPISGEQFRCELFCVNGGSWFDWHIEEEKEEKRFCLIERGMDDYTRRFCNIFDPPKECLKCPDHITKKKNDPNKCQYCGASRIVRPSGGPSNFFGISGWQFICECDDPAKRP